jgi:adenine-specific DNA-methyltransferase
VVFRQSDFAALRASEYRCLLMRAPKSQTLTRPLLKYLALGRKLRIHNRSWCVRRKPWFVVPTGRIPDAFLLYMSDFGPRLVVNRARAYCTNAIHALTWHDSRARSRSGVTALASLTSLAQLSAELEGRSYGGGVLKLEPSEASKLLLPLATCPGLRASVRKADQELRVGRREEAAEVADLALLRAFLSKADLLRLREATAALRDRRRGRKGHREACLDLRPTG